MGGSSGVGVWVGRMAVLRDGTPNGVRMSGSSVAPASCALLWADLTPGSPALGAALRSASPRVTASFFLDASSVPGEGLFQHKHI